MEIKMETQVLTFEELDTIRGALLVASKTDLPTDTDHVKVLLKIDYVMDKYCKPPHYNAFALLPILAKNDEE